MACSSRFGTVGCTMCIKRQQMRRGKCRMYPKESALNNRFKQPWLPADLADRPASHAAATAAWLSNGRQKAAAGSAAVGCCRLDGFIQRVALDKTCREGLQSAIEGRPSASSGHAAIGLEELPEAGLFKSCTMCKLDRLSSRATQFLPSDGGDGCASERVARASHRADDHLVDVHVRRLLDRVAHRIGDRVGFERDAAQLVHGRFRVVDRDVVAQF